MRKHTHTHTEEKKEDAGKAKETETAREAQTKENNKIKFKIHLRPKQIGSEIDAHTTKEKRKIEREVEKKNAHTGRKMENVLGLFVAVVVAVVCRCRDIKIVCAEWKQCRSCKNYERGRGRGRAQLVRQTNIKYEKRRMCVWHVCSACLALPCLTLHACLACPALLCLPCQSCLPCLALPPLAACLACPALLCPYLCATLLWPTTLKVVFMLSYMRKL